MTAALSSSVPTILPLTVSAPSAKIRPSVVVLTACPDTSVGDTVVVGVPVVAAVLVAASLASSSAVFSIVHVVIVVEPPDVALAKSFAVAVGLAPNIPLTASVTLL